MVDICRRKSLAGSPETFLKIVVALLNMLSYSATKMKANNNRSLQLGNNEQAFRGVYRNQDGTWLAMTFTMSKTFKTEAGAVRWFEK